MYVSISAVSPEKYVWYTFEGKRPVTFNDHHRTHDLKLEKGDRFGIRTYGSQIKLVELSDLRVIFTLGQHEADALIRQAKGFSGRFRGVKLQPGDGGAGREFRPEAAATEQQKLFPSLPMPPKTQDVLRLYHYFNKLHFRGECPDKVTIQFSESLRKSGEAMYRGNGGRHTFKLRIAKRALTDVERVINVVLHEMIHLRHMKMAYVELDSNYIGAAHGPFFVEDMNRLNKLGYRIEIREDDVREAELARPEYVLVIETTSEWVIVVHFEKPFRKRVPALIEDVLSRSSSFMDLRRYVYGTTRNSYVYNGNRLTKQKTLPTPRRLLGIKDPKISRRILDTVKVIEESTLERKIGDVRSSVLRAVDKSLPKISETWTTYLIWVLGISNVVGQRIYYSHDQLEEDARKILTQDEYSHARYTWESIDDRHILDSPVFKDYEKKMLLHDIDGDDAAKMLADAYASRFAGRVDPERYAALCVKRFGEIITVPDDEIKKSVLEHIRR